MHYALTKVGQKDHYAMDYPGDKAIDIVTRNVAGKIILICNCAG